MSGLDLGDTLTKHFEGKRKERLQDTLESALNAGAISVGECEVNSMPMHAVAIKSQEYITIKYYRISDNVFSSFTETLVADRKQIYANTLIALFG